MHNTSIGEKMTSKNETRQPNTVLGLPGSLVHSLHFCALVSFTTNTYKMHLINVVANSAACGDRCVHK